MSLYSPLQYNWENNIEVLFKGGANKSISGDEPVLVRTPSYFQDLSPLFSEPLTYV